MAMKGEGSYFNRGGTEPTVTDANLVMNRIDPNYFLGGTRKLDLEASRKAIKEKIAEPLKMTVEDAAEAILTIIDGSMQAVLRTTMARKGAKCGFGYCEAEDNFKHYCLIHDRDPEEVYPKRLSGNKEWYTLREFYCPGCGAQVEVEATPLGNTILKCYDVKV